MTQRSAQDARNESWRKDLFFAYVAQKAAERRRAEAMRHTIILGIAIGVLGSIAFLFQPH